tara:strand:- start:665 stop:847 length:183 start_codon:yes stop_codon:yes gene_type:complete
MIRITFGREAALIELIDKSRTQITNDNRIRSFPQIERNRCLHSIDAKFEVTDMGLEPLIV